MSETLDHNGHKIDPNIEVDDKLVYDDKCTVCEPLGEKFQPEESHKE